MKRALLFLLLFGSSLALVLWLERREEVEPVGEDPPTQVPVPPTDPDEGGSGDGAGAGAGAGNQGTITPGDFFLVRGFTEPEEGRDPVLRFEVRAEDSDGTDKGLWKLVDVTAELFDPVDAVRQVEVRAESGLATMVKTDVPYQPDIESLELSVVEALVERGAPVTPLTVNAPIVDMPLEKQYLIAPREAVISGPGLSAVGNDALLDLPNSQFTFRDGGAITIERLGEGVARFESDGELRAYRASPDASALAPLFLAGVGGSRIVLQGARDADLAGREILLRADEPDAGEGFIVRSVEMEGDVLWVTEGVRLQAQTVQAELNALGEFTSARFEGLPSAELRLEESDALAGADPALATGAIVRIAGEGPMNFKNEESLVEIELEGPATVAASGVDLRAGGKLRAFRETSSGRSGFEAQGGVVLEGERSTLETAELDALFIVQDGSTTQDLRVETRGGARLVGTFGEDTAFTLASPDQLIAERIGTTWHVVEATNVVLTVDGPDGPLEARADRLADLDLEASSFLAEGNVTFESPRGKGFGERLRVVDENTASLEGGEGARARFESAEGWIEARTIDMGPSSLEAGGQVASEFRPAALEKGADADELYAISGERMSVTWEGAAGDGNDPETGRSYSLVVEGNVDARLRDAESESVIRSDRLRIDRAAPQGDASTADFKLDAGGSVNAVLRDPRGSLQLESETLLIERVGETQSLQAETDVRYSGSFGPSFEGEAHRFALYGGGKGRITPREGERLFVSGVFAEGSVPFELTSDEMRIQDEGIIAFEPEIVLRPIDEGQPVEIRSVAHRLRADRSSVALESEVSIQGETKNEQPWGLTADRVWFEGEIDGSGSNANLRSLRAEGNVNFELKGAASGFGDSIIGSPLGEMRLNGSPALIESPLFRLQAEWVDFDPELQIVVATGRGTILPNDAGVASTGTWGLNYLASRTLIEPDSLVLVLQEPVLEYPDEDAQLRSTWAALWLDRRRWMELSGELQGRGTSPVAPPVEEDTASPNLFGQIQANQISKYLSEAYFEGPIELTQEGDLIGRAGALYLDTVAGHGWIAEATVNIFGRMIGQDFGKVIVRADWLRHSSDGSLQADSATVTPCDHFKPHMRIVTGDLRFTPLTTKDGFELSMRDNRIELYDLIKIPLPPIRIGADSKYEPLWQTLRLADSARFGTFVSAGIVRPADKLGKVVNNLFKGNKFDYDANYKIDASYLGSRGVLLDLGLETESNERYWLDMYLGGLPDRGEDRGYIRVNEDDRDDLRLWYRADGRLKISDKTRVDVNATYQTDPGVQSEFFESDFQRYERDESYFRYTRASNGTFFDATVVPNLENFRSQVEELPSVSLYGGRRPVGEIGGVDILYMGEAKAASLNRRAGDLFVQSPFSTAPPLNEPVPLEDPPLSTPGSFEDGLGDRDVLRLDTDHRLEAPFTLKDSGVRATPFVGTRLTAWDEGVDRDESPLRWRAEAGVRFATSFWKRTANGLHQIVPFLEARGELAMDEDGGEVVPFDGTEGPIDGNFVDVGFRGRFGLGEEDRRLDVEIFNTWADDVADGQADGWLPTSIFARLEFEPFGRPFELWHDGRHDISDGETAYSLIGIATRWNEDLRIQASHRQGRAAGGERLFEAATVRGVYRWTEKWEFEGRQTFSLLEDDDLDTDIIVRRYGHDVVIEVESSVRAGEGTSLSISIKPRFGFSPSRIGYLSY